MKQNNPINMAEAMKQAFHEMPTMLEGNTLKAQLYRDYYNKLMNEGFTKTQALELVKVEARKQ